MAAPSDLAPIPPQHMFGGRPSEVLTGSEVQPQIDQPTGQNHDRWQSQQPPALPPFVGGLPPMIPPPNVDPDGISRRVQPSTPAAPHAVANEEDEHHSSDDDDGQSDPDDDEGSEGNHDESDDDYSGQRTRHRWRRIPEDKSEPCEDEMTYIKTRKEHSAIDHAYWQKKTFFDLKDPEILPGESGRIDWTVEKFNGTKEAPNNETIMRSSAVRIGGYDWRIKFYPKGNDSDYLSVYIENVTMQDTDFGEFEDFTSVPFPVLAGQKKLQRPRSCAVQLSVIMYNPAEPRTYEVQTDAHQFTKRSADYGWTRFTRCNRHDFFIRNHGQRQAILRNDTLAFVAYLRVVKDPTGCLWAHGDAPFPDSVSMTGLRPWSPQHPQFAAFIPLLHFAPFRDLIYRCSDATSIVGWLQTFLWKMLSRTCSAGYGKCMVNNTPSDAIWWLQRASKCLKKETDASIIDDLIGDFEPGAKAAIGEDRLKTKDTGSVQAAIDAYPTKLATPALLTLELERQHFDPKKRQWSKITNRVDMPNTISIPGKFYPTRYTLFAFVTHVGALTSNKFNFYVRPNGPGTLWYAYTEGRVTCLTHKQAVEPHCGIDASGAASKSSAGSHHSWRSRHRTFSISEPDDEVAQVVMYVRDDVASSTFVSPQEETWNVPDSIKYHCSPKADETASAQASTVVSNSSGLHRSSTSTVAAGDVSPRVWLRDCEGDVVMSDASDGEPETGEAGPPPSQSTSLRRGSNISTSVVRDGFGVDHYRGGMLRGQYHGQGSLIATNGNQYTGNFAVGLPHGHGTMIYATTGNTYTGAWQNGQHHGHGSLTEAATGNVFEGGWKHGRKHGSFVLRGTVTEEDQGTCSICYEREINTAFYDCGHVVACKLCAAMLDTCPVCRRRVTQRVELFGVKVRVE